MSTQIPEQDPFGGVLRYGGVGEGEQWKLIQRAYLEDKVEAAYTAASAIGDIFGGATLGLYRMIEGEALAREHGKMVEVDSWLKLEASDPSEALQGLVRQTCEAVGRRMGWDFSVPALVTILTPEADAPWHEARYGYQTKKTPYDKICLPAAVVAHEKDLWTVLSHEYAHVVTLNRTGGQAPEWVEEGISMYIQGESADAARKLAQAGPWREVHELNTEFHAERRDNENRTGVWDAYTQALGAIHFLVAKHGEASISKFLGSFADNSFLEEVKINIFGQSSADEALRETYQMTETETFAAARDWLKSPA